MADKKIIAVDLDGTLAQYFGWQGIDHFGDPFPGAVEFTHQLKELGEVWIHSCRSNPDEAEKDIPDDLKPSFKASTEWLNGKIKQYLDAHGFHYDRIYAGPGKLHADVYIDDKGLDCRPGTFNKPDAQNRYYKMVVQQARYRVA